MFPLSGKNKHQNPSFSLCRGNPGFISRPCASYVGGHYRVIYYHLGRAYTVHVHTNISRCAFGIQGILLSFWATVNGTWMCSMCSMCSTTFCYLLVQELSLKYLHQDKQPPQLKTKLENVFHRPSVSCVTMRSSYAIFKESKLDFDHYKL